MFKCLALFCKRDIGLSRTHLEYALQLHCGSSCRFNLPVHHIRRLFHFIQSPFDWFIIFLQQFPHWSNEAFYHRMSVRAAPVLSLAFISATCISRQTSEICDLSVRRSSSAPSTFFIIYPHFTLTRLHFSVSLSWITEFQFTVFDGRG